MGTQLPPRKGHSSPPVFETAGWIKMPLGTEVSTALATSCNMGNQLPPKEAQPPIFNPCLLWPNGQTAGWIKTPLGTEIGLWPGHIVLGGDQTPPPKRGHNSPPFSARLLWPNGWMDDDSRITMSLGMEVGIGPGDIVLDRNPAPPPAKGTQPQIFGPCLLWPNGWID